MKQKLFVVAVLCLLFILPFHLSAQKQSNMASVLGTGASFNGIGVFVGISGNHGAIFYDWQDASGQFQPQWTPYLPAPDDLAHGLVAGRDRDGKIVAAWISNGDLFTAEARNSVASLGTRSVSTMAAPRTNNGDRDEFQSLVIANDADGLVEVLALSKAGQVFSVKEQTQQDAQALNWAWSPSTAGGHDLQNISVAMVNGRLTLAAAGADGQVYLQTKDVDGTWHQNWSTFQGNKILEAYVQESVAHQLEVIALGSDRSLYLRFFNTDGSLSPWKMLLQQAEFVKYKSTIIFQHTSNGQLFLIAHQDAKSSQFYGTFGKAFQIPNNGDWSRIFFPYIGNTLTDYLGSLKDDAFTMTLTGNATAHFFVCRDRLPQVMHYTDNNVTSSVQNVLKQNLPDLPVH